MGSKELSKVVEQKKDVTFFFFKGNLPSIQHSTAESGLCDSQVEASSVFNLEHPQWLSR